MVSVAFEVQYSDVLGIVKQLQPSTFEVLASTEGLLGHFLGVLTGFEGNC